MKHSIRFLVALVACAACKKGAKESAPAAIEDNLGKDGAKGGSGPGGPNTTGVAPDVSGNGRARGGTLQFLDGDLEIAAGAIDKDVVRKVVKDNTTKLQYCYEKTLLAVPTIEGKVIATFTIAAEGHVDNVKATGVHPDVEACVAETVKAFKFPPSGKKVDVSYPFTFRPA